MAPVVRSGGVWGQAVGLYCAFVSRLEDVFTFSLLHKEML
jgi:hypothetical protein